MLRTIKTYFSTYEIGTPVKKKKKKGKKKKKRDKTATRGKVVPKKM